MRGKSYLLLGSFEKAIEDFEFAKTLDSGNSEVNLKLKDAISAAKIYKDAISSMDSKDYGSAIGFFGRMICTDIDQLISQYSRDSADIRVKKLECAVLGKNHGLVRTEVT